MDSEGYTGTRDESGYGSLVADVKYLSKKLKKAEAERDAAIEECARVCDEVDITDETGYGIAADCANAIRALAAKGESNE